MGKKKRKKRRKKIIQGVLRLALSLFTAGAIAGVAWASMAGDVHTAEGLHLRWKLWIGADIDGRKDGRTPLHDAITPMRDVERVRVLLDHGADVEALDDTGHRPLYLAADLGLYEITEALIDAGADVDARSHDKDRSRALDAACRKSVGVRAREIADIALRARHVKVVRLLVERGADLGIFQSRCAAFIDPEARFPTRQDALRFIAERFPVAPTR